MADLIADLEKQLNELLLQQKEALSNLNSAPGIKIMIAIKKAVKGFASRLYKEIDKKILSKRN